MIVVRYNELRRHRSYPETVSPPAFEVERARQYDGGAERRGCGAACGVGAVDLGNGTGGAWRPGSVGGVGGLDLELRRLWGQGFNIFW